MLKDIRLFTFRIVFRPQTKSYYLSRWSRESCCSSVVAINRLLQTPSFLFFCRYISDANKKALCLCCVQDYKSHLKTKFGQGQDTIIAVLSLEYFYYMAKMLTITTWTFLYVMPPVQRPTGIYALLAICCI